MWFKNIQIYRLLPDFRLTQELLTAALQRQPSRACSQLEKHTFGWISPLGVGHDSLVYSTDDCLMLAAAKREKILPSSVVREEAAIQILFQEKEEGRALSKRERRAVYDKTMLTLLPQALCRTSVTYAYFDLRYQLLLIDTASQKCADEMVILLRDCLGRLPMALPQFEASVSHTMTDWVLHGSAPTGFNIDDFCELQQRDKERALIRCQQRDVMTESIRAHLHEGMQVIQLGMTWNDRLSFVLDQRCSIKKIQFLELASPTDEQEDIRSPEEQFDADFRIFSAEFAQFIPALVDVLGGFTEILRLEG